MLITTARTTWERIDFIIVFLLLVLKARMHKAFLPVGFIKNRNFGGGTSHWSTGRSSSS
jgi:hypothetical protein